MEQMIAAYDKHGGNIIAVEEVPADQTHQYGIVSVGQEFGQTFEITGMVEKPPQGTAPSNFIISGRYILQPQVFDLLSNQQRGAGNEIQLTDSMIRLMRTTAVLRHEIRGADLRYRLQDRLPDGQCGLCAGTGRSRPCPAARNSRPSCARNSAGGSARRPLRARRAAMANAKPAASPTRTGRLLRVCGRSPPNATASAR